MSISPNIKNPHYVWCYYLETWAAGETFWCYRDKNKKLFATQPKAIASETYFYEARRLTAADVHFLESIIATASSDILRDLNRNFVFLGNLSFAMREFLKNSKVGEKIREKIERELHILEKDVRGALSFGD